MTYWHWFSGDIDGAGGFGWGFDVGCGGAAGWADRSAGGLEFRFAIRALSIVVQVFALVLRNGIGADFGVVQGSAGARAFRFAIRALSIVVHRFAVELRNEAWGIRCGVKSWSWVWKPVGVVLKK